MTPCAFFVRLKLHKLRGAPHPDPLRTEKDPGKSGRGGSQVSSGTHDPSHGNRIDTERPRGRHLNIERLRCSVDACVPYGRAYVQALSLYF